MSMASPYEARCGICKKVRQDVQRNGVCVECNNRKMLYDDV